MTPRTLVRPGASVLNESDKPTLRPKLRRRDAGQRDEIPREMGLVRVSRLGRDPRERLDPVGVHLAGGHAKTRHFGNLLRSDPDRLLERSLKASFADSKGGDQSSVG